MIMVIIKQSLLCNKDEMVLIKVADTVTTDRTQQYRDIRDKKSPVTVNVNLTI